MRRLLKFCFGLGCVTVLCGGAQAVAGDQTPNQYASIARRNVFGLKEPVIKQDEPGPVVQLPKVFLTGITTVLNQRLAFLKTQPQAKPGGAAVELYFMLSPGQKQGEMEIIEIDEKAGRVKIIYAGTPMELTFDKDAPKSNPPANIAGQPGAMPNPPNASSDQVPTASVPGTTPPQPGTSLQRKFPGRNLNPPSPPLPGLIPGATQAPANPAPVVRDQRAITPEEEQQILTELERLKPKL